MASPNLELYNAADDTEITAINYGSGDAGDILPTAAGTEYHLWNDKGAVLGSDDAVAIRLKARDSDGNEVDPITVQKWVEVKSTTIHDGDDGGDSSGEDDDDMSDFQPIGKDAFVLIGNIPSDCYRKIFVRVNIPPSAEQSAVTFSLLAVPQVVTTAIANYITDVHGDGVIPVYDNLEVTDNAAADSVVDIAKGIALINDIEVLVYAQTKTLPTDADTYKVYVTQSGVVSYTTTTIPTNSIELARVVIADSEVESVTDKRVFIGNVRAGLDAAKTATPKVGMIYIATDTNITYACYVADTWSHIGVKNKLDADTAPTINDDESDGYSVGSTWIDINNWNTWICVDATEGSAAWQLLSKSPYSNVYSVTSPLTLTRDSSLVLACDCTKISPGAITINLPDMSGYTNTSCRFIVVKTDSSANAVTIDGNGETINGGSTYILNKQWDSIELEYSGGGEVDGWLIISARKKQPHVIHFQDLLAADTDGVHAAITGTGAENEVTTAITNPDVPRNVTITTTNNDTPSGDVVITGLVRGVSTTDTITISAGGTASGVKAFDTITKITIPATVSGSDTVTVGIGDILGLPKEISATSDVYKKKVNNEDKTSELSGNINATYGTVDCSTIVANEETTIWYLAY